MNSKVRMEQTALIFAKLVLLIAGMVFTWQNAQSQCHADFVTVLRCIFAGIFILLGGFL